MAWLAATHQSQLALYLSPLVMAPHPISTASMIATNPFTERGRITDPARFAGRWSELSLIFDRLERGRPVLLAGPPGIGKSSLLTHITQAAAVNLDQPDLRAFYLNVFAANDPSEIYRTVIEALGGRGDTATGLRVALIEAGVPLLLCLDDAQMMFQAGWGERLLDDLARIGRTHMFWLIVAFEGERPTLSEPFAQIGLGVLKAPEVRLLTDAYLDGTGIAFTSAEIRELEVLSAAHPAYLQRAAFHLFESKFQPGQNWRAAYLQEVRDQPVAGAPLPPEVFAGAEARAIEASIYGNEPAEQARVTQRRQVVAPEHDSILVGAIPLLLGILVAIILGNPLLGLLVAVVGVVLVLALRRHLRPQGTAEQVQTKRNR